MRIQLLLILSLAAFIVGCHKPDLPDTGVCSLTTDDVVDVAIVTVIAAEYDAMLKQMDCHGDVRLSENESNNFAWRSARIERPDASPLKVIIAMAGEAGTTSGALATLQTAQTWRPGVLVLAGIAGGLDDKVSRGDVVVADAVWGYDYGAIGEAFTSRRDFTFRPDAIALAKARGYTGDWTSRINVPKPDEGAAPDLLVGVTASGNKVIETQDSAFVRHVLGSERRIASIEMEAAGAFAAAELLSQSDGAPALLMVRGISDIPNPVAGLFGDKKDRERWKQYAAVSVAAFTRAFLQDEYDDLVPVAISPKHDVLVVTDNAVVCSALEKQLQQENHPLVCMTPPLSTEDIVELLAENPTRAVLHVGLGTGLGKATSGDVVVGRQSWPFASNPASYRPVDALRASRALLATGQSLGARRSIPADYKTHFGAVASSGRSPSLLDEATIESLLQANARTIAVDQVSYLIAETIWQQGTASAPLFLTVQGIDRTPGETATMGTQAASAAADVAEQLLAAWPIVPGRD
ncbi:MAG: hypothetical protein AB8F65_12270 [Woeseiaceae bacterium]